MESILIGDVGATGSDWVLVSNHGATQFSLGGYNPISQADGVLDQLLLDLRDEMQERKMDQLHFYGAGIGVSTKTPSIKKRVVEALGAPNVYLYSDLLGAARAVCDRSPGVVCILGTGSNACFYDGNAIENGHSLGYPLGDEGSGMDIGRRLVKAYYYGLMPVYLRKHFTSILPTSRIEFLTNFKGQTAPNRYLAGLTSLLQEIKDEPFIQETLALAFTEFVNCHLSHFKTYSKINAIGSIAYYFCGEFEKCLKEHRLCLGKVKKRPIEGLMSFHVQNLESL